MQAQRPSTLLQWVRLVQVGLALPVVVAGLWVLRGFADEQVTVAVGIVAGVGLVGTALGLVLRCRSWRYEALEAELAFTRGALIKRSTAVPYLRVQFIDITAGPVERAFGLSTFRVHTAAATGDLRIPGLPTPVAVEMRERLTALLRLDAGGF